MKRAARQVQSNKTLQTMETEKKIFELGLDYVRCGAGYVIHAPLLQVFFYT